ncbi:hypothetical protein POJ06DRAFT_120366 [Lipomyces tetrasporus]|uniref:F-box domain-containing protein n=1 Tax=Lipomyces tetrasporus TaxID=54092 RepID=A0AAD7QS55_9ASCO|nr:uncharacterized protein POJ06DRAFT_120366 [Lipomyces tetrasporus]KAJ8099951.1 hypothetical protein POJ06DRAFT_120366 [Lipomyces tetrasporus]
MELLTANPTEDSTGVVSNVVAADQQHLRTQNGDDASLISHGAKRQADMSTQDLHDAETQLYAENDDDDDEDGASYYWNHTGDLSDDGRNYSDVSTDYDIDIYWADRPVKLRNRNKRLKRIRRQLMEDYGKTLTFHINVVEADGGDYMAGKKFPPFLYKKKWGLVRSQIPAADGSSPITKLPTEILQNIFYKLFFLRLLDNFRKMDVAKVACVCKRFNEFLQPILFSTLNIASVDALQEFGGMLLQSPHLGPLVHTIYLKLNSSSLDEAANIARNIGRIVHLCPNLRTLTVSLSGRDGRNLVMPNLGSKYFEGLSSNSVHNLNFLFECYTTPFTLFAQGFENVTRLQFGHIDLTRMTIRKRDMTIRLNNVVVLQLMAPILGSAAIRLIASALPRVQFVDATAVSSGIIDLLSAIAARTNTLSSIKMRKCNGPNTRTKLTRKLWTRLRSIEMTSCSMMTADIFPTHKGSTVDSLPNLEVLRISADIKLPIRQVDFIELLEAVDKLREVVGHEEQPDDSDDDGSTAPQRVPEINITCENCAYGDTFGSVSFMSAAPPYSPMPGRFRGKVYKLLETVGPPWRRKLVGLDTDALDRFRTDLGISSGALETA